MNNKQKRGEIWKMISAWLDDSDPEEIINGVGLNIDDINEKEIDDWADVTQQIIDYCNGKVRECNV